MASRLRLHVLLPVVVLGALGLGVGAFALGKPTPPGGDEALPPVTTTHATKPKKKHEPRWVRRTNDWCEHLNDRFDALDAPDDAASLEVMLSKWAAILDRAVRRFPEFGAPRGKKAQVAEIRRQLEDLDDAANEALLALRTGDSTGFKIAVNQAEAYGNQWSHGMKRLGATVCSAKDPVGASSTRTIERYGSAQAALNHELSRHRVVVVLFYAPGDDYDVLQTRETRAGALAADAGFLALNVKKNKQVAALAAEFDVLYAPATLVFKRGPKVAYRVSGYMDRAAVAQAATNAR